MRAMALAVGLAMLGGIGIAHAQNPQGGQAGMQGQTGPGMTGEMGQRMPMMGEHMGGRMGMHMMGGGGAIFAFRSPRGGIFVRCAADESMRACADAAIMMMHGVANMGSNNSGAGGPSGSGGGSVGTGTTGK